VPLLASLALVIWAFLSVVWLVSVLKRDSSIMDMAYALSCVVAAWVQWWLLGADTSARTLLILVLVNLWGWRYTLYIVARNLPHGEDARYARWRQRTGAHWWWWSYFQVFMVQGVMIWLWFIPVALALRVPGPLGALEWLALMVWLVGFVFEAGADWQLARFKRNPANRGQVLGSGLWSQCRHPNYFGEATIWCAYGLLGLAHSWGWLALLCTAYTVHMMNRGSATRMTDGYMKKRKPGYLAYAARTPSFVPRMFGGRPDRVEISSTGEAT
jgi:steroid 5-alpha reductase family enzyme